VSANTPKYDKGASRKRHGHRHEKRHGHRHENESTCCSVVVRVDLCTSCQARSGSSAGQNLGLLPMTMLITLS